MSACPRPPQGRPGSWLMPAAAAAWEADCRHLPAAGQAPAAEGPQQPTCRMTQCRHLHTSGGAINTLHCRQYDCLWMMRTDAHRLQYWKQGAVICQQRGSSLQQEPVKKLRASICRSGSSSTKAMRKGLRYFIPPSNREGPALLSRHTPGVLPGLMSCCSSSMAVTSASNVRAFPLRAASAPDARMLLHSTLSGPHCRPATPA